MIVEDVAVLIDLDEGDALVLRGRFDDRAEMFDVDIDRARNKRRFTRDRQRQGIDRVVNRSRGRRLRLLTKLRSRTVLTFRQTVDAVVEKNVVDVEVAPNCVNEVVAADRKCVTIAGDHPHTQVWIGALYSGCDCRRATVNAVKAIGVHVIGKTRRATDTRNKHDLLARNAEFRHHLLHVVENRVVAAAWTPAHFLIGNKVSLLQLTWGRRNPSRDSRANFAIGRDSFNDWLVSVSVAVTMSVALCAHSCS